MGRGESHGRIASLTPGRARIRIHPPHRQVIAEVKGHLESRSGIRSVVTNAATGSVLVHFDHHAVSGDDILAMCRDIGVVVENVAGAEADGLPDIAGETPEKIIGALDDLDRRFSRVTGRRVDLRVLIPLGLGALGLRQLIVEGLGQASGYILIWIAFDTVLKLRRKHPAHAKANGHAELGAMSTPVIQTAAS